MHPTFVQSTVQELEPGFIGDSSAFHSAVSAIQRIARCNATALVLGETGTGKELAARAIHYLGLRRDSPFVPVNCGAIPETLFESELFGHAKGAFTDAKEAKAGLVSFAQDGTLFLDEIECLSPKGQVVLLRFLQDLTFRPLGGKTQWANVRIVAAGNRNLFQMAHAGEFRLDLYYRLALLTLTMPPLRERHGDPELLANYFVQLGSTRFGVEPKKLHAGTVDWFNHHSWPGNVRELEYLIYREMLLSESNEIRIDIDQTQMPHAERRIQRNRRHQGWLNLPYQSAKAQAVLDFDRDYLNGLLAQAKGNIAAAARLAGKERRTFDRLLKRNEIDKTRFRG